MTSLVKRDGLRVMFYDKTDRDSLMDYVKKGVGLVDDSIDPDLDDLEEALGNLPEIAGLSHLWQAGASMYRAFGRFDYVIGVSSWDEALRWLANVGRTQSKYIKEAQYWGHGGPGSVWIGETRMTWKTLRSVEPGSDLEKFLARLRKDSLVWFRCCAVFQGSHGHRFAKACTRRFECDVAAHTHIIAGFQSGLHLISPGQEPHWDKQEGRDIKTNKIKWSGFFAPNTITMLHSNFPVKLRGK